MKIKFVDGVAGYKGAMVASINGSELICGQTWKSMYSNERGITVVRQRSWWFTALIFVHESAHHINNKLFKHKLRGDINIWIDKHMIRGIDKRKETILNYEGVDFLCCKECGSNSVPADIDINELPQQLQDQIYNTVSMGVIEKDIMKELKNFVNK